jgi:hypothetical protein
MKKLNNIAAAFVMMAILILGTTAANAGILVSDATGAETTSSTCTSTEKADWGIMINGIIGIMINGLGGILDIKTSTPTNCGIMING